MVGERKEGLWLAKGGFDALLGFSFFRLLCSPKSDQRLESIPHEDHHRKVPRRHRIGANLDLSATGNLPKS